jgi:hypothetical protein
LFILLMPFTQLLGIYFDSYFSATLSYVGTFSSRHRYPPEYRHWNIGLMEYLWL